MQMTNAVYAMQRGEEDACISHLILQIPNVETMHTHKQTNTQTRTKHTRTNTRTLLSCRLIALDRALPLTFSAVVETVEQLLHDCVQPPTQPSCNATTIAAIGVDIATCVAKSKLPFGIKGFSMAQCLLGEPDTAVDQCEGCLLTESFEFFMNETEKNSTNSELFPPLSFSIEGVRRNAKTTFFLDDAVTYCMADAPTTDAPTDAPATTSGASCLLVSSLVACIFAVAAAIA